MLALVASAHGAMPAAAATSEPPLFTYHTDATGSTAVVAVACRTHAPGAVMTVSICQVNGIGDVYLPDDSVRVLRIDEVTLSGPYSASA